VLDRLGGIRYVEELADSVLEGRPADYAQHFAASLASELELRGRVEEALQVVDAALARFPDPTYYVAWLHCKRGTLHRAMSRTDLAILDLEAANTALAYAADPLVGIYVEILRAEICIDLGLLVQALRASREIRVAADAALVAQLPPDVAALRDRYRWKLRVDPEAIRYNVQMAMEDYEGALQSLDALLSDAAIFPPQSPRRRLGNDARLEITAQEPGFRIQRGVTAVKLLIKEQALGRPERAREAAAKARAELEPLYELDLGAAIAAGQHPPYLQDGLIYLALLEFLERRTEAAQRALARRAWGIQAGFLEVEDSFEVFTAALETKIHLLQLQAMRAPESVAVDGDTTSADAVRQRVLEKDAANLAAVMQAFAIGWRRFTRPLEGLGILGSAKMRFVIEAQIELEFARDPAAAPRRVFELTMRTLSVGSLAGRIGGPQIVEESPARAEDYLSALPPGSGVFIVLPLPTQSYVLTADAQGVQASHVASQYTLEELAKTLIREAGTPPSPTASAQSSRSSRLAAASAELSAALFPTEVAERVSRWKRIVFVGTELLGQLPMESLTLAGRSIGATHATSYAPGLALADVLAQRWPATRRELGVRLLAGPHRDDELGLNLGPDVAQRLLELAGSSACRLGSVARLDEAGLGELDQVQVLAFLAHGHYLPDSLRPAAVALAPWPGRPDGLMTCEDVEALAPRVPPLTLFLTCRSAAGPRIEGDAGISDLGGAALLGGAACALLATSDIALNAATALLEDFLGELEQGRAPDEALAEARRALAQRPGFDDPFFLHTVRLFGVAHLPLVSAR
jgi:hypothetical protein